RRQRLLLRRRSGVRAPPRAAAGRSGAAARDAPPGAPARRGRPERTHPLPAARVPAMIVAWDARKRRDGGIGSYIRHTLGALARRATSERYVALVNPADDRPFAWDGDVTERPVRAGAYGIAEHWRVAQAARSAEAALLHAPHYTLPLGWSGP